MKKLNIPHFGNIFYPYLKSNLRLIQSSFSGKESFKKYYDNLPCDPYVDDHTRRRRYANYKINYINDDKLSIYHTGKTIFQQKVDDNRNKERTFELIEEPYHPFLLHFLTIVTKMTHIHQPIQTLIIDAHQVRQVTFPTIESHNSKEGIHQDGCDYIISACVLNRYNISGGISSIYTHEYNKIYETLLEEDEFIFQNDKDLYHYVTPIMYESTDTDEPYGYRDIIGFDITIVS